MIVIVCYELLSHIKLSGSSEVEGDGLVKADIYCVFHNVNISRRDCKKPELTPVNSESIFQPFHLSE